MAKTIAIDFDGVIHKYSKGWHDGSIYDEAVESSFQSIQQLFISGYTVFIFSTRSPKQIKKWMIEHTFESEYEHDGMGNDPGLFIYPKYKFRVEVIPFWVKFWNKPNVIGVTKRKLPALCYIDDRALKFEGDWNDTITSVSEFKTYQT